MVCAKGALLLLCLLFGLFSCRTPTTTKYQNTVQLQPKEENLFEIMPRSSWTDEGPDISKIQPMKEIYRITIHHTAMPDDELSDLGGDSKIRMQKILLWHKHHNQWADVGYHYVIDQNGKVWEGRSIQYQGAHAGKEEFNIGNIGVVLVGNFETHEFPEIQKKALSEFIHYLRKQYHISANNVFAHETFTGTKCPGKNVTPFVDELRKEE